jgi:hypothetical protein
VRRYSDEFKLTAVRLSQECGIQVQTVAADGRTVAGACPTAAARAQVRPPPSGARPLKQSHPVLCRAKGDVFAFLASLVVAHDSQRSVSALCRRRRLARRLLPREGGAHMESFFHSLEAELTRGVVFADDRELRRAPQQYMRYYNTTRLHSSLGYRSPLVFEQRTA